MSEISVASREQSSGVGQVGIAVAQMSSALGALAGAGALVCLAGGWQFTRRLVKGLKLNTLQLDQYAQARFDGMITATGNDQLTATLLALKRVQTRLGFEFADTSRRAEEAERIRQALDAADPLRALRELFDLPAGTHRLRFATGEWFDAAVHQVSTAVAPDGNDRRQTVACRCRRRLCAR